MKNNIIETDINTTVQKKAEKIESAINNIKNKKSKFLFCVPDSEQPSASVYEIYFHANVMKECGYSVLMLTSDEKYIKPDFVDVDMVNNIEHMSMKKSKLTVGPEDFMVIPEVFSTAMEQTKSLPCKRIGLLQSFDYMLNAMVPGMSWLDFEVKDIITTSETLKNLIERFYGNKRFNIKYYSVGIPKYFNKPNKPKKPIISIVGRNPNEITKIVKLFYSKYPHFGWVIFDPMLTKKKPPTAMRRVDFAERLKENFAAVWVDRISSFGTFPLECMATETIPISLKPDITPEYLFKDKERLQISENIGFWTNNYYDIPEMINDVLTKFLDDTIPVDFYDGMRETASKYSQENSKNELINMYGDIINERIAVLSEALETLKNK